MNIRRVVSIAVRHPCAVVGKINQELLRLNSQWYKYRRSEDKFCLPQEDWDNVIILDAFRYDTFEALNNISGKLRCRTSPAGESWEFMKKNYCGKKLHDTVYITANPHAENLRSDIFYNMIQLSRTDWNKEYGTVLPSDVVQRTLEAYEQYPNKRFIIHFMQPHYPFIGETGRKFEHRGHKKYISETVNSRNIWGEMQFGLTDADINRELIVEAYSENAEIALDSAQELIEKLDGKSIITSDHGTLLGERTSPIPARGYGHPWGIKLPEITQVPWLEIDSEARREIVAESPVDRTEQLEDTVMKDQLRSLGYVPNKSR